jgi:hypothetical protein
MMITDRQTMDVKHMLNDIKAHMGFADVSL